jgi:hypothetical protein
MLKGVHMRKVVVVSFIVSLSLFCAKSDKTLSIPTSVITQPQTKCENSLINIQFDGETGWFPTTKKCDMSATPAKVDTTHASGSLTQAQLDTLLRSYLSGTPRPAEINVCCCQPGWQVYNNSHKKCSGGKVIDR